MTTRAERRRSETRARITRAARDLLHEEGAAALRLTDVAERADVAFGSLYTYFENKEAIVDAVVAETLADLLESSLPAGDAFDDPAELVAAAARRVVRIVRDEPQLAVALLGLDKAQDRFVDVLAPRSQELLEQGAAANRFSLVDAHAVTRYLLAGGFELIRGVVEGRYGPDADRVCAEISLRTLGIAPDEARSIVERVGTSLEPRATGRRRS